MASLKQQRTHIRLQNLFLKNNSRATSVDIHRQCEGDVTVRFVASEPRGKRHDVCHRAPPKSAHTDKQNVISQKKHKN